MSRMIEPPNSVLPLVGREEFTPPKTFAGQPCVATPDCIAVAVLSVDDGPTFATLVHKADTSGLIGLGEFSVESEGRLSLRDIYNREHAAIGVEAGSVRVRVFGNDVSEPCEVTFLVGSR